MVKEDIIILVLQMSDNGCLITDIGNEQKKLEIMKELLEFQ